MGEFAGDAALLLHRARRGVHIFEDGLHGTMDALQRINQEDGITVVCNLHTLDTARTYCEHIVGMAHGKIVFSGGPDDLTTAQAREIYGAGEEFNEAATSTSISHEREVLKTPDTEQDDLIASGKVVNL